jgi:nicotinamide-nucleotide amidase
VDQAEAIIRKAFPDSVFTTGGESLEEVVVRLLAERSETVATAESCTGGYIAHRLTNVSGASAVFLRGFVTYSNEAKIADLGVHHGTIDEHGAVSAAVAREMAEGARRVAATTHALATTGIAGPTGGSAEKPVGTVYIAFASDGAETQVERRRFLADRESFKRLTSQAALDMLRRRLLAR